MLEVRLPRFNVWMEEAGMDRGFDMGVGLNTGMVMSGQNVGGNLSGQQTSFTAMGTSNNQQWTMDGAVVSDIASGNSSPTYYDFDSFEEINVTKGGSDASQQGAGVQVNFITKSGGNTLRG